MTDKVLVPARLDDIPIGAALPYSLYGRNGALLAQQGFPIADEQTRQRLVNAEPYREAQGIGRAEAAQGDAGGPRSLGGTEHKDPLHTLRHNVEAVQLQFQLPGDPERRTVAAQFCGRLGMQALLVTAPHLGGVHRTWHNFENLPLNVRMTSGRTVYAFESEVVRYAALPLPHLYLRYPTTARRGEFRGAVRLETRLPAVARMADGRQLSVTIVDLSGAGCAVESEYVLGDVGSSFTLIFRARLSEQSYTLTLPVVIRNLPRVHARGVTRHGLAFGDEAQQMDWHLRLAIKAYIYEMLLEG